MFTTENSLPNIGTAIDDSPSHWNSRGSLLGSDAITLSALPRLLQLTSTLLPVGAYAYSNGLETAVARGWIHDEPSVSTWIHGMVEHNFGHLDLPLFLRLYAAWDRGDVTDAQHWSRRLSASREAAELRREDIQLGRALWRLLRDLGEADDAQVVEWRESPFAAAFAFVAVRWHVPALPAAMGLAFATVENGVAAAMKLIPLGQTAGQRILGTLADKLPGIVEHAARLRDDEIGSSAPGLALVSAWHEQEYTRLFQS